MPKDDHSVSNPEQLDHNLSVLKTMKIVLSITSALTIVAIGTIVFLYIQTRPQLVKLKQEAQDLKQQAQDLSADVKQKSERILSLCSSLAVREFNGHDFSNAIATLAQCKQDFPKDYVLPNYEAEISVRHYWADGRDPMDLVRAANAAHQSLSIAPNYVGYEWQGIVSCIRVGTASSEDRQTFVSAAVMAFKSEFELQLSRKATLLQSKELKTYCPAEVRSIVQRL